MTKHKILIVDDNEDIRKFLGEGLKEEYHILLASNGEEALKVWHKEKPSLVILDIMMPDMSGYEVCTRAKNEKISEQTPIIFHSAKQDNSSKLTGYSLGAINYISKPTSLSEIKVIVKSILKQFVNEQVSEKIQFQDLELNLKNHSLKLKNNLITLTPTEFRMLELFLQNPDRIFSREAIIFHIAYHDSEMTDRTIDSHISHLRSKLKPSKVEILTVYGEGYLVKTP